MWLCRVAVNCYCFPVLRIVLAVVLNNARTKFKTMLTQLLHSLNWLSIRLNWTCALISVVKHIWNSYQRCLNESIKYCHKCKIPAQGDTGVKFRMEINSSMSLQQSLLGNCNFRISVICKTSSWSQLTFPICCLLSLYFLKGHWQGF